MAAERDKDDIAAALHGLSAGASDSTAEHADDAHAEHVRETRRAHSTAESSAPEAFRSDAGPRRRGGRASPAVIIQAASADAGQSAIEQQARGVGAQATRGADAASGRAAGGASGSGRAVVIVIQLVACAPSGARHSNPSDAEFEGVADDDRGADDEAAVAATQALDYHGPRVVPRRPRRTPYFKTLGFRRTMIPVLLTSGVMMIATAVTQRVADEEAPLARMPGWTGIALVAIGLVLVGLGVLNMLMVRGELAKNPAK